MFTAHTAELKEAQLARDACRPSNLSVTMQRVINNPHSGERILICQSGTDSQLLAFALFLRLGAHVRRVTRIRGRRSASA